jgi:nucleotide-binding universal stress UspA family protein
MYSQMLIPLDGSKTAAKVLPYARTVARSLKIPVKLMAVTEVLTLTAGKAHHLDTLVDAAIRRNQEYLQKIAKTFTGVSIDYTVEAGAPEEAIIMKAAANKGTLITMATHGRSGVRRWLLGSVAEKVLRGSSNPVLLVRANEEAETEGEVTLSRIIVALDGSELAEAVLPNVAELAKAINLKVILLRSYTLTPIIGGYEGYIPDLDLNELKAESKSDAVSYLDSKVQQLRSQGLDDVTPLVSEGEAAETIIELARGSPNSVIAMSTHGRSGVMRWVLGSVTEKVVRHSGTPVLVIRAT